MEVVDGMRWNHSFALKSAQLLCCFPVVKEDSALVVFFEKHLIWTEVLTLRRAEKEWMAGRLPVKSLRVSTSSLACFCHKMLFGPDLIALHSAAQVATSAQDTCTQTTLRCCAGACSLRYWCELYQSSTRGVLKNLYVKHRFMLVS